LNIAESFPDVFGLGQNAAMNLGRSYGSAGQLGQSDPRGTSGGEEGWRGSFLNEVRRLMPIIERPQSEGLQQEKS